MRLGGQAMGGKRGGGHPGWPARAFAAAAVLAAAIVTAGCAALGPSAGGQVPGSAPGSAPANAAAASASPDAARSVPITTTGPTRPGSAAPTLARMPPAGTPTPSGPASVPAPTDPAASGPPPSGAAGQPAGDRRRGTVDKISQNGCVPAGCTKPVSCPSALDVKAGAAVVGCISACARLGGDQYCCQGPYSSRADCNPAQWPVDYAAVFKSAEPYAYSYVDDDATSVFTCSGVCDYRITFGYSKT
ncbi:MAG TPA: thaumatin family protein [Trebonia sp.]